MMFGKLALCISVLLIPLWSSEYSGHEYTSVYECTDVEDISYTPFVNIDYNSLHLKYNSEDKTVFLFDYNKTIKKNDLLEHHFIHNDYSFVVTQNPKNPINFFLQDYENKKIRYEYNCIYKTGLKQYSTGESKIPITWREVNKNSIKLF